MRKKFDKIPLSKLKGINVYYDNDLYDAANLILKLKDSRQKHDGSNIKSRPTVNGLVRTFANLIDPLYPEEDTVLSVIKKFSLPLNAAIEYDEDIIC